MPRFLSLARFQLELWRFLHACAYYADPLSSTTAAGIVRSAAVRGSGAKRQSKDDCQCKAIDRRCLLAVAPRINPPGGSSKIVGQDECENANRGKAPRQFGYKKKGRHSIHHPVKDEGHPTKMCKETDQRRLLIGRRWIRPIAAR